MTNVPCQWLPERHKRLICVSGIGISFLIRHYVYSLGMQIRLDFLCRSFHGRPSSRSSHAVVRQSLENRHSRRHGLRRPETLLEEGEEG